MVAADRGGPGAAGQTPRLLSHRKRIVHDVRAKQFAILLGVGAGSYLLLYGLSIMTSLSYVFTAGQLIDNDPDPVFAGVMLGWTMLVVITSIALLRLPVSTSMMRWPAVRQWPWADQASWPTVFGAIATVTIALELCRAGLAELLQQWGLMNSVWLTAPRSAAETWMTAIHAGVGEEVVALAIPVTILRYYRVPTKWALMLLVGMRAAYHLYYGGLGVLWLMPWAVAAAAVYWRWRDWRILVGLVALHIVYDVVDSPGLHILLASAALITVGGASWATRGKARPSWLRQPATRTRSTMWLSGPNQPQVRPG